jgi:hypothetical protein
MYKIVGAGGCRAFIFDDFAVGTTICYRRNLEICGSGVDEREQDGCCLIVFA